LGVQLGGLIEPRKLAIDDLSGRIIAFDGNNILYQFLAIIRGRQGEPLKDKEGRITSHLSGLLYRNSNLMEAGIKIIYVFDGTPHKFKKTTLLKRKKIREKAKKEYQKALREGDRIKAKKFGQQAILATPNLVKDAKKLLKLMGIPCIQAPGEGEAQSAYMAKKEDVWGSASQDFDSLLYGAPKHIRNLSITGRRKLPGKNVYIKIEPEIIELIKIKKELNLTQNQLIEVGILLGTDYNPKGIKGVGPKTALKLIHAHGNLENALKHIKNAEFPHPIDEIKELFLNPRVTDEYILEWDKPNSANLVDYLCGEHDFNKARVINAIKKMNIGFKKSGTKTTLDRFFSD
jgi:flap endonuclease-1